MQLLEEKKAREVLEIIEGLNFPIKVRLAGVTFGSRQHYIKEYCRIQQKYFLMREPDNKIDENAIRVLVSKYKADIGYIPRKKAEELAPLMDAGIDLKVGFCLKLVNEKDLSKPVGIVVKIWI
jgi:hypothetical protein